MFAQYLAFAFWDASFHALSAFIGRMFPYNVARACVFKRVARRDLFKLCRRAHRATTRRRVELGFGHDWKVCTRLHAVLHSHRPEVIVCTVPLVLNRVHTVSPIWSVHVVPSDGFVAISSRYSHPGNDATRLCRRVALCHAAT